MCLESNGIKKKAKRNIVCFKACHPMVRSEGSYHYGVEGSSSCMSPYRNFMYKLGSLRKAAIVCIPREGSKTPAKKRAVIYDGLHSFSSSYGAEKVIKEDYRNSKVYACIIPKGATYYVGTFNGCNGYASNRLIVRELYKRKR